MQVAALIFLGGTKCLITSEFAGDVETMNENNEDTDEENPRPYNFITSNPTMTKDLIYDIPTTTIRPWIDSKVIGIWS